MKARQYQQHHVMQAATSTRNPKKFWTLVKKSVDIQSVPPIWDDKGNELAFEDKNKANLLNTWFVSCQQKCDSPCSFPSHFPVGSLPDPVSGPEISRALKKVLVPGKASGPFLMSIDLLLHCGSQLVTPLVALFNSCLFRSEFPRGWKLSYVTAIPKGSPDSTRCTNWRPISLLHPLSKVFETVLADRLRFHLESQGLLSDSQFGFREKRSTELLTTLSVQEWKDHIATGAVVDAVFLDCQKAFDRADHFLLSALDRSLLSALDRLGVSPVLLNLFSDYLRGRQQITAVDGASSEPLLVTSGVPQGSVLGPLMYLCLVDTAAERPSPRTSLKLFADDLTASRIIRSPDDETEFQTDLDLIFDWANANKLTFNATKSVFIRFNDKRTVPEPPKYHLGSDLLPRSNSVNYLGVQLDQ